MRARGERTVVDRGAAGTVYRPADRAAAGVVTGGTRCRQARLTEGRRDVGVLRQDRPVMGRCSRHRSIVHCRDGTEGPGALGTARAQVPRARFPGEGRRQEVGSRVFAVFAVVAVGSTSTPDCRLGVAASRERPAGAIPLLDRSHRRRTRCHHTDSRWTGPAAVAVAAARSAAATEEAVRGTAGRPMALQRVLSSRAAHGVGRTRHIPPALADSADVGKASLVVGSLALRDSWGCRATQAGHCIGNSWVMRVGDFDSARGVVERSKGRRGAREKGVVLSRS